jgi:hypothetical protein
MNEVPINEPLRKVYALFEEGKIRPIAIEWGKQKLKVTRVNSSWIDRSLRPFRHGFSLTMEAGEIFQISYEEGNPVWRLEYILTD